MALGIEWVEPLPEATLAALFKLRTENEKVRTFLPAVKNLPGLRMTVTGDNQGSAPKIADLAPIQAHLFDLSRMKPDGSIEWSIGVRPDFVTCNCGNYKGWKAVKPVALELLQPFADRATELGASIKAIGIQYLDVFRWRKGGRDFVFEVLSKDSKWLPKNITEWPSIWHVNQGWFSPGPDGLRVLNVLNIELVEETDVLALKVQGTHSIQVTHYTTRNQAYVPPLEGAQIVADLLASYAETLHIENKRTLLQLLTEPMRVRIGLKPLP